MSQFRFEDLEIWKMATNICSTLFDIADSLQENKKFRFAEQLSGASMSITNNIAEGSGSSSNKDFASFLNYSRRSVFECANIVTILNQRNYIDQDTKIQILEKLDHLSRMITNFRKNLLK